MGLSYESRKTRMMPPRCECNMFTHRPGAPWPSHTATHPSQPQPLAGHREGQLNLCRGGWCEGNGAVFLLHLHPLHRQQCGGRGGARYPHSDPGAADEGDDRGLGDAPRTTCCSRLLTTRTKHEQSPFLHTVQHMIHKILRVRTPDTRPCIAPVASHRPKLCFGTWYTQALEWEPISKGPQPSRHSMHHTLPSSRQGSAVATGSVRTWLSMWAPSTWALN
jgi:hypothetical protein